MTNRLAYENSPYLLQHAENPVDWYPWGQEALETAEREKKPIFLSIGYAACHWCHVMAHESFEDPSVADYMNQHFINIKVDREERPDLDSIYMNAVVAITGQGGWPMSVFLTPDGKPFFGGTYYPPSRRYGMPSFREVLESVAMAWNQNRERLLQAGDELTGHIKRSIQLPSSNQPLNPDAAEDAVLRLSQAYDWQNGGWGPAPKFPQPMVIEFLLSRAAQGDQIALDMAVHALKEMAKGGMYDVIGGGFSRYSTDEKWLVPHFEKMLYDNAQLALVYLHTYLITGEEFFRRICEDTLAFLLRELLDHRSDGEFSRAGFFSSLDADTEGEEGKYYVWELEEIREALSDHQDASLFITAFGVSGQGNFEGKNVLQRVVGDQGLADRFGISVAEIPDRIKRIRSKLLNEREKRVRPGIDDKVLVSWNALVLQVFSQAARYLDKPYYLEVAQKNAAFLLKELHPQDRLLRSWRNGKAKQNAFLEDYAGLILGLLDLYQSDPNPEWYQWSIKLVEEMIANYSDPDGGFFDTRTDEKLLIALPKELQDNATPSGNSLAALSLLKLSAYSGEQEWREMAEGMMVSVNNSIVKYPTSFGKWLCALQLSLSPLREIAVLGDLNHPQTTALISTIWSQFRPFSVVAASPFPPDPSSPPLLFDRPLYQDQPTAYVCEKFVCKKPVNSPGDFQHVLLL